MNHVLLRIFLLANISLLMAPIQAISFTLPATPTNISSLIMRPAITNLTTKHGLIAGAALATAGIVGLGVFAYKKHIQSQKLSHQLTQAQATIEKQTEENTNLLKQVDEIRRNASLQIAQFQAYRQEDLSLIDHLEEKYEARIQEIEQRSQAAIAEISVKRDTDYEQNLQQNQTTIATLQAALSNLAHQFRREKSTHQQDSIRHTAEFMTANMLLKTQLTLAHKHEIAQLETTHATQLRRMQHALKREQARTFLQKQVATARVETANTYYTHQLQTLGTLLRAHQEQNNIFENKIRTLEQDCKLKKSEINSLKNSAHTRANASITKNRTATKTEDTSTTNLTMNLVLKDSRYNLFTDQIDHHKEAIFIHPSWQEQQEYTQKFAIQTNLKEFIKTHEKYFTNEHTKGVINRVNHAYKYKPRNYQPGRNPKILLISVHGTNSNEKPGKIERSDFGAGNTPTSKTFHIFAQQIAYASQSEVDFYVYNWSGGLDKEIDREPAGKGLAHIIQKYKAEYGDDTVVYLIGHSHGGNVIRWASHYLSTLKTPINIDNALMIATPQLDLAPDKTKGYNIRNLISIWGESDFTGNLGSVYSERGGMGVLAQGMYASSIGFWSSMLNYQDATASSLQKPLSPNKDERVVDIRFKVQGDLVDHIEIKGAVMQCLSQILYQISTYFLPCTNLVCNYHIEDNEKIVMMAIDTKLDQFYEYVNHPAYQRHLNQDMLNTFRQANNIHNRNLQQYQNKYGSTTHMLNGLGITGIRALAREASAAMGYTYYSSLLFGTPTSLDTHTQATIQALAQTESLTAEKSDNVSDTDRYNSRPEIGSHPNSPARSEGSERDASSPEHEPVPAQGRA